MIQDIGSVVYLIFIGGAVTFLPLLVSHHLAIRQATIYLVLYILFIVIVLLYNTELKQLQVLHDLFLIDTLTQNITILLTLSTGVLLLMLNSGSVTNNHSFELVVLILLALIGLYLLISTTSLLLLFVALELASLTLYLLAASERDTITSLEASLKYFTLGAFASSFILLGSSLIYGFTGLTSLTTINLLLDQATNLELGLLLLTTGLLFKLGAAPYHI